MKKTDQDKDNFLFTKRWIDTNLPFGLEQTTDVLYRDFFNVLIESNLDDSPSVSAFRSRLGQIDFISSRYVKVERHDKMIRMKAWYKVELVVEPEPCVFSKYHDKAMQLLAAGRERLTWVK